jgi:hypothetical protein
MIRRSWARTASIEETLALWAASLREVKKRIRPLFGQERVAKNAGLFLEGLLGDEQRKTGWMRAEAAGDPGPWRQQAILGRRDWDADGLRDIVRDYVIEHLADDDAVLVIDETGFLKQGKASCGVARQYTGSAGKITNCQTRETISFRHVKAGARWSIDVRNVPNMDWIYVATCYEPRERSDQAALVSVIASGSRCSGSPVARAALRLASSAKPTFCSDAFRRFARLPDTVFDFAIPNRQLPSDLVDGRRQAGEPIHIGLKKNGFANAKFVYRITIKHAAG